VVTSGRLKRLTASDPRGFPAAGLQLTREQANSHHGSEDGTSETDYVSRPYRTWKRDDGYRQPRGRPEVRGGAGVTTCCSPRPISMPPATSSRPRRTSWDDAAGPAAALRHV
jgi:hypothetical protein